MPHVIALVSAANSQAELDSHISRLLDKQEYDELIISEDGEGFEKALARAREVHDPIISMVSLGAMGKDAQAIYGVLERIVYEELDVSLRFKHLDYSVIDLQDAPHNTISGDGLKTLLRAVESYLAVEQMIALDSDRRHKIGSSDREAIKELAAAGKTQKEIARTLGVSRSTVARHWASIKLEGI